MFKIRMQFIERERGERREIQKYLKLLSNYFDNIV